MANPLLPAGRSTPVAAYIRLRNPPPFNPLLKNGVTVADRRRQPSALQGAGISSAVLGAQNGGAGMTTIKATGGLGRVSGRLYEDVEIEVLGDAPSADPIVLLFDGTTTAAYVGNSYTQQFDIPAATAHYINARISGGAVTLGPPPFLASTIADDNDGYYPAMSLGGMALFPTYDQRQGGNTGTTDAIDAVATEPLGTYDAVILTSGFIQEDSGIGGVEPETVPGSGADTVILEVKRRVVAEIQSRLGPDVRVLVRMTHEGYNTNTDTDLSGVQDLVRLQVLGARQLELENVLTVVPEHYVWSRLQYGAFGSVGSSLTDPVPAYASLTHSTSSQAGQRNWGWLNRTQGTVAPFNWNTHQNAIASIVAAWTWGYLMWGIDPRGDTTFTSPVGLPTPLNNFISPDGSLIYGGQQAGIGNVPFDTDVNPGGPPDSELVLDWSATPQLQIQERIVAAVDDFVNGTTEFD